LIEAAELMRQRSGQLNQSANFNRPRQSESRAELIDINQP
jgi:hypothetical protein